MALTFLLLLMFICGISLMLFAAVAFIQDKKMFTSAPKDIQAAIQPREERFKGAHAIGWVLLIIAVCMIVFSLFFACFDGIRRGWSFGRLFVRFLIMLDGYKLWDMLFLDRYLLTKSHFYQHYFPEVEGCESLKKAGFNTKQQLLKFFIILPAVSAALAALCLLFE